MHLQMTGWRLYVEGTQLGEINLRRNHLCILIYATTLSETSVHLKVDKTATLAWINK